MHHEGSWPREADQAGIDLVPPELLDAFTGFCFLTHGDPDIGIKQVRTVSSGLEIFGARDSSAGAKQQFRCRLESPRGGDPKLKSKPGSGKDPRIDHVTCAISDKSH